MARRPGTGEVWEGEYLWTLDRLTFPDGAVLTPGDASGPVDLQVFDANGVEIDFAALDESTVLFDPLVVDGAWTADNVGYNFKHIYDTGSVPLVGGQRYSVIYTIPTSLYGPQRIVVRLIVREVLSEETFGV